MFNEDDEERHARTLADVLEARDALEMYLEDRKINEAMVGAIGKKGDYGLVVYLPRNSDPTLLIPVQIDGIPVRTAKMKTLDRIQPDELQALAQWYDTHCSVSGDPILQGPCNMCGKLGSWEVDPYIEEIYDEEQWNFWCEQCYSERADDI
jgi:hypothetical protein